MLYSANQTTDDLVTIIAEDYGTDVPLPQLVKVVECWGIARQPIIDIVETDGHGYTRYIEQGRKVSGKREANQIARDLGATVYC